VPGGLPRWLVPVAVAALVITHFVLATSSVRHKSNTYDELVHLTRGYSYALTGDYRLGPPHPPLAHWWAALPGRGMAIKFPPLDSKEWHQSDVWNIGRQFFFSQRVGNPDIIDGLLFRGRVMIALLSSALVALVFAWAQRLWGTAGGLVSLILAAFSPTLLAHGALVTTDCAVALFFLASLAAVWGILQRITALRIVLGAAALACLFLSKMSAVLIIPTGLVLMAIRLVRGGPLEVQLGKLKWTLRGRGRQAAAWGGVMLLWAAATYGGIWAGYGFRYAAMRNAEAGVDTLYSNKTPPKGRELWDYVLRDYGNEKKLSYRAFRSTALWLRDHHVLPEAYVYSAVYARQTARGRSSFLDGKIDLYGFRSFFPKTFLYKTPLPLFGMLALAGVTPWLLRRDPDEPKQATSRWATAYRIAPLVVFFVIYWGASLRSVLNIGHRHVLPTYPVLFILCGAVGPLLAARKPAVRVLVPGLVGLFVAGSLWVYPNYLAYFNLIAGGPKHGYRHLVDSSLDWGQDLPALRDELARRRAAGENRPVYLAYFGSGGWTAVLHHGITATWLPAYVMGDGTGECALRPGLYAISATQLQQVYARTRENRWTVVMEHELAELRTQMSAFCNTPNTAAERKPLLTPAVRRDFARYQALQFARLCAYLREREPDDFVGYSILLYALDDAELKAALEGPVPTVSAEVETTSTEPETTPAPAE
jgi:4-amino-4-deoxy-L-arabinose transferase-like glycosyltransferase